MGHKHSHEEHSKGPSREEAAAAAVFKDLGQGNETIKRENFDQAFGKKIGHALWHKFAGNAESVNLAAFTKGYAQVTDLRTDQWIEMFPSVEDFFDACLSVLGSSLTEADKKYIADIKSEAQKTGLSRYFDSTFPGLLAYTILRKFRNVIYRCYDQPQVIFETHSAILSPLQFVLLQASLSESVYFKHKTHNKPCWTRIYDSAHHGLSVNRYEAKVFGYQSPSVAIFKLNDGHTFAISTNTEWKHSTKPMGTTLSRCFQLTPTFKQIESRNPEPIFCNFKYKSSEFGLGFKDAFKIPAEFDNVAAIEVWGCGDDKSIEDQETLKARQRAAAERNQKVPLPGNWDENPDKSIMEMAGFKFSNERNKPGAASRALSRQFGHSTTTVLPSCLFTSPPSVHLSSISCGA
ncbi:TLDc domain-containing protein [Aphelenchoides fujianensis]|nr:TLDc domain-containing protein [Aphelenchoides fujianensis]